jgi:hypothetical protein
MFIIAKTLFVQSFAAYIAGCSCCRDPPLYFVLLPNSYKGTETFASPACSETRTRLKLISRQASGVFVVSSALLGWNLWNLFF